MPLVSGYLGHPINFIKAISVVSFCRKSSEVCPQWHDRISDCFAGRNKLFYLMRISSHSIGIFTVFNV